jgi:hypothetical protein
MLTRRAALSSAFRSLAAVAGASLLQVQAAWPAVADHVVHSDAEWRKLLTPAQICGPAQGRDRAGLHQSPAA